MINYLETIFNMELVISVSAALPALISMGFLVYPLFNNFDKFTETSLNFALSELLGCVYTFWLLLFSKRKDVFVSVFSMIKFIPLIGTMVEDTICIFFFYVFICGILILKVPFYVAFITACSINIGYRYTALKRWLND